MPRTQSRSVAFWELVSRAGDAHPLQRSGSAPAGTTLSKSSGPSPLERWHLWHHVERVHVSLQGQEAPLPPKTTAPTQRLVATPPRRGRPSLLLRLPVHIVLPQPRFLAGGGQACRLLPSPRTGLGLNQLLLGLLVGLQKASFVPRAHTFTLPACLEHLLHPPSGGTGGTGVVKELGPWREPPFGHDQHHLGAC